MYIGVHVFVCVKSADKSLISRGRVREFVRLFPFWRSALKKAVQSEISAVLLVLPGTINQARAVKNREALTSNHLEEVRLPSPYVSERAMPLNITPQKIEMRRK